MTGKLADRQQISPRALGVQGEQIAADFLIQRGLRIIERNWRAGRTGEIDIIALHRDEVVFVEVKTRRGDNHPLIDTVDERRLGRLKRLAQQWLGQCGGFYPHRVDLIGIAWGRGDTARLFWQKGIDR